MFQFFTTVAVSTQVTGESEASQGLDGREWTLGTFVNSFGAQNQSVRGQWGAPEPSCPCASPAHPSPQVGDQGQDTSGQAAAGAQQGQHRLFLVPVLGFLPSSICISLILLLFGHLGLIPVIGGSLSHWHP